MNTPLCYWRPLVRKPTQPQPAGPIFGAPVFGLTTPACAPAARSIAMAMAHRIFESPMFASLIFANPIFASHTFATPMSAKAAARHHSYTCATT